MGVFLLNSCSYRYFPVETQNINTKDQFAIFKKNNVIYAAKPGYWIVEPDNLNNYFDPFYLNAKNIDNESKNISYDDIYLLDEEGNQYDVISVDKVEELLFSQENIFLEMDQFMDQDKESYYEDLLTARNNLINYSFTFGKIMPRAQKKGYIFFKKISGPKKKLRLFIKDQELIFKRK